MLARESPQRVAVVKRLRALAPELPDRADMGDGALADPREVLLRVRATQLLGLLDREAGRDVAVEGIVSRGLIGDDVDIGVAAGQLREDLTRVAEQADGEGPPRLGGIPEPGEGVVEVGGALVEIAGVDPALDAAELDLDAERGAAAHRHRQRLGSAHAP